jgi:hypothetical protein
MQSSVLEAARAVNAQLHRIASAHDVTNLVDAGQRRARFRFTWRGHFNSAGEARKHRYRRLLRAELSPLTSFVQLAITRCMDLSLSSRQHILRRHVTDRAVQAHGVVVIYVELNQVPGILQGQRCERPDALAFLTPVQGKRVGRFGPLFKLSLAKSSFHYLH